MKEVIQASNRKFYVRLPVYQRKVLFENVFNTTSYNSCCTVQTMAVGTVGRWPVTFKIIFQTLSVSITCSKLSSAGLRGCASSVGKRWWWAAAGGDL